MTKSVLPRLSWLALLLVLDCLTSSLSDKQGFEDYPYNFTENFEDVSGPIEEDHPNCIVVPLSRLTVNDTGIENGDFSSFSVSLFVRRRRRQ